MRTNVDKGFCTNDMAGANGRKLYYVSIATHQKQINGRKWQLISTIEKKQMVRTYDYDDMIQFMKYRLSDVKPFLIQLISCLLVRGKTW